jgi:lysozyme
MRISQKGLDLIEYWEELVLYVYDDKVPKRRIGGKLAYPEWDGRPVRGTLTIGYGHTDDAGAPKIMQGMRITETQANAILAADLRKCERVVERLVTAKLTQHQFDCLVSFTFNCAGENNKNIRAIATIINAGDYEGVPARLMRYVYSKGERMQGLVNRRIAEVRLWNTPDDPREAEVQDVFSPKAEAAPNRSIVDSKTATAAGTTVAVGAEVLKSGLEHANDVAAPLREAQGNLQQLGIWDQLMAFAVQHQLEIAGAIIVGLGIFIVIDRWRRLQRDHL